MIFSCLSLKVWPQCESQHTRVMTRHRHRDQHLCFSATSILPVPVPVPAESAEMSRLMSRVAVGADSCARRPADQTHLSALLGAGGGAAGAAGRRSQEPGAAKQSKSGTRQTPGGHLELAEAPPGRHTGPEAAGRGQGVGLAEPALTEEKRPVREAHVVTF